MDVSSGSTHQGTNIVSHLGKRTIIFKSTFGRGYIYSPEGIIFRGMCGGVYVFVKVGMASLRFVSQTFVWKHKKNIPTLKHPSSMQFLRSLECSRLVSNDLVWEPWAWIPERWIKGFNSTNRLVGPECSRSIGFEKVWFLNELHRLAWFKQMWYVWEQVTVWHLNIYIYIYIYVIILYMYVCLNDWGQEDEQGCC